MSEGAVSLAGIIEDDDRLEGGSFLAFCGGGEGVRGGGGDKSVEVQM